MRQHSKRPSASSPYAVSQASIRCPSGARQPRQAIMPYARLRGLDSRQKGSYTFSYATSAHSGMCRAVYAKRAIDSARMFSGNPASCGAALR